MTAGVSARAGIDKVSEWALCLGLFCFALLMRLDHLARPHSFEFDETYYAKNAWSLLNFGYSRAYVDGADAKILAGHTTGQWAAGPEMITHPEVGKWMIAIGEKLVGMQPFGWRISSAVVGALMVLLMVRFTRRVTGSLVLGLAAGLLMTFDGLQLVLSRLALIDLYVAFFSLLAVHCLVADRDWMRARVTHENASAWGPRLWWRPWLLAAGVSFGLAVGTKWNALYLLAACGLLFWAWSASARRRVGVRRAWLRAAVLDAAPAVGYLVLVPFCVYLLSWTGWLMNAHAFEKAFSHTQYGPYWGSYIEKDAHGLGEVEQSLRSLYHYHHDVYAFHTKFLGDATHPYQSNPAGWLLLNRPVAIDAQLDIQPGEQGCTAPRGDTCLRTVVALGNPVVWWFGSFAALWCLVVGLLRRDWRHLLATVGIAVTWLPWLQYDDRPIFSYYAILTLPFLLLATALLLGDVLGPDGASRRRRIIGAAGVGGVVLAAGVACVFFWPIWTDGLLTHSQWVSRMWFQKWI